MACSAEAIWERVGGDRHDVLRTPDAALVSAEPSRNSAGRSGDADDDTMVAVEALLGLPKREASFTFLEEGPEGGAGGQLLEKLRGMKGYIKMDARAASPAKIRSPDLDPVRFRRTRPQRSVTMTSLSDLTHKTLSRMENRALHHILQQQRLHIPGELEPFEPASKKLLGGAVRSLLAHASSPSVSSPSPHPTAAAAPSPSPTAPATLSSQQDLDLYLGHEVSSLSLGLEPDRRSRLSVCMPAKKRASGGYAAAQVSRSETPLQLQGAHEAVQRLPPRCVSCVPTLQGESSCPALLFTSGPCPPARMPPKPGGSSWLNRTDTPPGSTIPDPTYCATPADAVPARAATAATVVTGATAATAALMGSAAALSPGPSYSPSPSISSVVGAASGAALPTMFPARGCPSCSGSGGCGGSGGSLVSRHSLPMLPPSLKIPGQGMGASMSSLASEARRWGSPVTPNPGAERSTAGRAPLAPPVSVGGGRSPMGQSRVRVVIGAQGVPSCSMLPALPAAISVSLSERAAPAARLRASPKP